MHSSVIRSSALGLVILAHFSPLVTRYEYFLDKFTAIVYLPASLILLRHL